MDVWAPIFEYLSKNSPTLLMDMVLVIATAWTTKQVIFLINRLSVTEKESTKIEDIIVPKFATVNDNLIALNGRMTANEKESIKIEDIIIPKFATVNDNLIALNGRMTANEKESIKIEDIIIPKIATVNDNIIALNGRVVVTEKECSKIEDIIMPKLAKMHDDISMLNSNVNSLVVYLKSKDSNLDASLFLSKSPIQLTSLGEKILEDIGGREFIDQNIDNLLEQIDAFKINTALDVHNYSPMVIDSASRLSSFNKIKDFLFRTPNYKTKSAKGNDVEVQLDLSVATNIMGIYLRDKYLEKRPELRPKDPESIT